MAKRATTQQATKKRARRQPLPGMDDSGIPELEELADSLEAARDTAAGQRKEAAELEGTAEQALRTSMHEHGKEVYIRDMEDGLRLEIRLRPGAEKVLMRRRKVRAPSATITA